MSLKRNKNRNTNNDTNLGMLDLNYVEGSLMDSNETQGMAKEFVYPGKTALDMMMRTNFRNEREAKAITETMNKMEEFGDSEGMRWLLQYMAAACSINGKGQKNLLQAITGYYDYVGNNENKNVKQEDQQNNRQIGAKD